MRYYFLLSLCWLAACAHGSEVSIDEEDDSTSASVSAVGSGGASSGCLNGLTPCGSLCVDLLSDSSHCGSCGHACIAGESCVMGQCQPSTNDVGATSVTTSSTTVSSSVSAASATGATTSSSVAATSSSVSVSSSVTSTVASTVASSSSSGGMGPCAPLSPAAVCGANHHCIPQTNGTPICQTPVGGGVQYGNCLSSDDCADVYECITTGFNTTYCMQWCTVDKDCPGFPFDTCYPLMPAVYVGSTAWGVCYDGFP